MPYAKDKDGSESAMTGRSFKKDFAIVPDGSEFSVYDEGCPGDDEGLTAHGFATRQEAEAYIEGLWQKRQRFLCIGCGKDTMGGEYYMVSDELWAASGGGNWMLCLACLERRIGRELTLADFTAIAPEFEIWELHKLRRAKARQL